MDDKVEIKISKKNLYGIIGVILLVSAIIFGAVYSSLQKDTEAYNDKVSSNRYNASSLNYFDNLKITSVSIITTKFKGWNSVVGELRNDSNKTLRGYLEVSFYSSSGQLVDSVPASFGPLSPGQTGTFEAPGTKQNAFSCKVLSGTISAE